MDLLTIFGYIGALVIGISLGLIGGGGSILAVPILAYLFHFDARLATAYSLFIVGASAAIGGWRQARHGQVDWRTAVVFGLPAIAGVWVIRHYVVPALPDVLFSPGGFDVTRRMLMFGLFAVLMLLAAFSMLRGGKREGGTGEVRYNYPLILAEGIVVGAITGFVGAGGGFLIIPALVVLANLDIKRAIGTSLVIIAIKSLMGFFLGDALGGDLNIDWTFLAIFTGLSFAGIFIGTWLSTMVDGQKLKKGFGYFILAMAVFVFVMEFVVKA